ncbi:MAG: YvcK family protein [Candidatus Parcubacteria bacterium]|nr:YvcK family protein [Candidatus Parcubacteria bacterium]
MKKIVTIGGGTGSFMLLSGLKKYPLEIGAIVSMADNGGSSGVLCDELGVLPPGDVRQCLVALSDASDDMRALMNYRFTEGGLRDHSFGNLFLSALEKTHKNFLEGIDTAMEILKVKGRVIPVTGDKAELRMELSDGTFIEGEDNIDHAQFQKTGVKKFLFASPVKANPVAVASISNADVIAIGPGDIYGSILANLIIPEIADAIRRSSAPIIYNVNLTNKKGQTEGFDVDDYVNAVERVIGKGRINFVLYNTKQPDQKLLKKYEEQEGENFLVEFHADKNPKRGYRLVRGDFLKEGEIKRTKGDALASSRSFIRHDSEKLAKAVMLVSELPEYESIISDIL